MEMLQRVHAEIDSLYPYSPVMKMLQEKPFPAADIQKGISFFRVFPRFLQILPDYQLPFFDLIPDKGKLTLRILLRIGLSRIILKIIFFKISFKLIKTK